MVILIHSSIYSILSMAWLLSLGRWEFRTLCFISYMQTHSGETRAQYCVMHTHFEYLTFSLGKTFNNPTFYNPDTAPPAIVHINYLSIRL